MRPETTQPRWNAKTDEMIGKRFNSLVVESISHSNKNFWFFKVRCDCGGLRICDGSALRRNKIKRCKECKKNIHKRHGKKGSSIWIIWMAMKARCLNPKSTAYKNYGGRGITLDPLWHDFEAFYADMGDRPEGLQLDRIDNNGPYTKENCRWTTPSENCKNRRDIWASRRKQD